MPRLGAKWCNQTSRSGLVASMVRTVDVTGSKPIGIPTKTVKISLHSQPHCATATGFHDYLSILSGETRSQTFQKTQFENSNNGFCNRRGARVESKKNLTSRPFCDSLKFEIQDLYNVRISVCVWGCLWGWWFGGIGAAWGRLEYHTSWVLSVNFAIQQGRPS